MGSLDQLAQPWWAWIAAASWQLAVLVSVVAVLSAVARGLGATARLRHALWLLVLVKVFLPPTLATPLSVGYWAVGPAVERAGLPEWTVHVTVPAGQADDRDVAAAPAALPETPAERTRLSRPAWLLIGWTSGVVLFWGLVGWKYSRLIRELRTARVVDEGPLRVALERIALELRLRRVPDLLISQRTSGPFLWGALRPQIVLPERLIGELSDGEVQAVLTHELVHWQRHDTWTGWLQVVAQSLYWFHPFVWWANNQIRHERECACDEAVLQLGEVTPQYYGESLVRVLLTTSAGRPLAAGSLVGVFERGAKLQQRLEGIMRYEAKRRGGGWLSLAVVAALAVLLLPMAPRAAEGPPAAQAKAGSEENSVAPADKPPAPSEPAPSEPAPERTPYPRIVSTVPKCGATDVDPSLGEIIVTFDRDMDTGGMSWTGDWRMLPPRDDFRTPYWSGPRTCVYPVQLVPKGGFYRVGINSSSYKNFRSKEGVPALPAAIVFATKGAKEDGRVATPTIVKFEPPNGAQDVDPDTKTLSVTFDVVMGNGMSWTGSGLQFPKSPEDAKAIWSPDGRTCTLPVTLEPGHEYEIGINSLRNNNFQSKWGVPLEPVVYRFRTRGN